MQFLKAPRHPKWREVNFAATLEGWHRSPAAQDWIDRASQARLRAGPRRGDASTSMRSWRRQRPRAAHRSRSAERADLFRAFIEWNKGQQSQSQN